MTSVVRFIKETELGSVFDDQATKAMGEAFEAACKDLDEAGQSSIVHEAVAKCIIEIAKSASAMWSAARAWWLSLDLLLLERFFSLSLFLLLDEPQPRKTNGEGHHHNQDGVL